MTTERIRTRSIIFMLLVILGTVFSMTSCSSNEAKAKKLIQEYMKNQGITDLTLDSFITTPSVPGKAYTSATVTYNFASSSATPQKEYLGFILTQEGNGWRIERPTGYTKDQQQAAKYLAGGK